MDLEAIKIKVAEFSDRTFGHDRPFSAPLHHLKKEVDEAIESGQLEEFADMQLLLLDAFRKKFPNLNTEDLAKACGSKLKICQKRKWTEPDENGVIEHVREAERPNEVRGLHLHNVMLSLPFGTNWSMKTVNTTRLNGNKDCKWAIDTGTMYAEGFKTPNEALKHAIANTKRL